MVSKVRESFLSRTDKSAFELLPDIVLQWMMIVVGLWCNWNYWARVVEDYCEIGLKAGKLGLKCDRMVMGIEY